MRFEPNADQADILSGLDQLIGSMKLDLPTDPVLYSDAPGLDAALAESGFIDIAREDGFGLLEAALVAERIARLPHIVEYAASAIVGPGLGIARGVRPIAIASGDGTAPARFLPQASLLIVDTGDSGLIVTLDPGRVQPVDTLFAYPFGRLDSLAGLDVRPVADLALLRRRWRIALAAEMAGCMAAALAQILDHVKTRHAFGRPLGAFQAIQHRLAMAAETAESTRWLALRAAWSDREEDAAVAAGFAQSRVGKFTYDLHQFSGAMGLTLEFPLHLWTYRLRALVGELGGPGRQARAAAAAAWPDAA